LNVLLVLCDSLRRDHVSCYGEGHAETPNIDRLDRAYSASYPTLPCRAELFTGRFVYPYLTWGPLPADEIVLADLLGKSGYDTAYVTDNPQTLQRNYHYDRGFHTRIRIRGQIKDRSVTEPVAVTLPCAPEQVHYPDRAIQFLRNGTVRRSEEDWCPAQTMRAAARWLEENARRRPFFLMVDSFDPHEPWDPPQEYVDRYDPGYEGEKIFYPRYSSSDLFTPRELQHMRALYAAEVTLVDRWVGHLLDCLDSLDLQEETAVIFFSDHGFFLGEHGLVGKSGGHATNLRGWPLYREVTAIPFMIRLPGVGPGRCGALVHPCDLMPTILDLCGVAHPSRVQAPSLMPLLRGETDRLRAEAISSWSFRNLSPYRPSTVRTEEWSLIYWRVGIKPELYHLPTDPGQTRDVYDEHRDVARELHGRYVRTMQQLATPAVHYWPRRVLWSALWGSDRSSELHPSPETRPSSVA